MALEFSKPAAHPTAVALVDASGSVSCSFLPKQCVFDKFRSVLHALQHDEFFLCFWSSVCNDLPDGTFKFPFAVKRDALTQPFTVMSSKLKGGTEACLAFRDIDDWMKHVRTVYLLTDGDIQDAQPFPGVVDAFLRKWPDTQLHLITVQTRHVDFDQRENNKGLVGADIYAALVKRGLTGTLSSFTAYTPNHPEGFKLIDRVRAPPGYLAFRDQLFRDTQMPQFFKHVCELVAAMDTADEPAMLRLLQDLVTPVARARRDKSPAAAHALVTTFASLFRGSCIDHNMAVFLLSDGCDAESSGRVHLITNLRSQLKEAFRQADTMLADNVPNACAMEQWVSLPMQAADGAWVVMRGAAHGLCEPVSAAKKYRAGAVRVGGALVGGLPLVLQLRDATTDAVQGGMAEQCTRQWVRTVVAKAFGMSPMEDTIMYTVMGVAAWVEAAVQDAQVAAAWANLARIMLRKRRLNSEEDEWRVLERGETPTPNNGTVEQFLEALARVGRALGVDAQPWQLWWAMCRPLGLTSQLRHCEGVDEAFRVQWPALRVHALTPESRADYRCVITLEDTAATGGMRIRPHTSLTGVPCRPAMVFSAAGVAGLLASDAPVCPYCYADVRATDFEAVPPYAPEATDLAFKDDALGREWVAPAKAARPNAARPNAAPKRGAWKAKATPLGGKAKAGACVVHLKGVVGCGKSTYAQALRARLEAAGKSVAVLSTDANVVACGGNFQAGICATQADAAAAADKDVIIVDTCGDVDSSAVVFGLDVSAARHTTVLVNFTGSADVRGLLAWALHNVLTRPAPGIHNGVTVNLTAKAGAAKCAEIWRRKATTAYSREVPGIKQMLKDVPTDYLELADLARAHLAKLQADGVQARQLQEACAFVGV
jgi:hypothetical protein